jgi:hypothetical protein
MKSNLILPALLLFCSYGFSQSKTPAVQLCPSELKWTETKPPLLPGAQMAVLEGNPMDSGHFTMRIKLPPRYKILPHSHPQDERTTIISGVLFIGPGEVLDTLNGRVMLPGCFYVNPANVPHYAFTMAEETVIQISTNGPWGFSLVKEK